MIISNTNKIITNPIKLSLLVFFCFSCQWVKAACSVADGSLSFGQTSSFNIYNNSITTSNNVGLSCSGLLGLGILTGDKILVTLLGSANNLSLTNNDGSGDNIPYAIYADSGFENQFLLNQPMDYGRIGLLTIILGGRNFNITLYARTAPGANIRAGTYSDTLVFNWDYSICTGLGILNICLGRDQDNVTRTVTINLEVDKQCTINDAPDINFGNYALIGQFNPITQSVNLTCTKTEGYKISFSDGNNRLPNSWRRMTDGSGNFLEYNIYQTDGSNILDNNYKINGNGTGISQTVPYKAIINPSQTELPAGTYSDQIIMTVEY